MPAQALKRATIPAPRTEAHDEQDPGESVSWTELQRHGSEHPAVSYAGLAQVEPAYRISTPSSRRLARRFEPSVVRLTPSATSRAGADRAAAHAHALHLSRVRRLSDAPSGRDLATLTAADATTNLMVAASVEGADRAARRLARPLARPSNELFPRREGPSSRAHPRHAGEAGTNCASQERSIRGNTSSRRT
jgi:hypothetical protein